MEIDAPAAYFTPGGGGYVSIRWWITGLIGLVLGLGIVGIEFLVRPTLMDPKSVEDTLDWRCWASSPGMCPISRAPRSC